MATPNRHCGKRLAVLGRFPRGTSLDELPSFLTICLAVSFAATRHLAAATADASSPPASVVIPQGQNAT
jgi:hypothetical protein